MSKITDFYSGEGTDNLGRSVYDILGCDGHQGEHAWAWMEVAHDWVQWFFPIRKESNFNPDAPILSDDDVAVFKEVLAASDSADKTYTNVMDAIEKFVRFLGIEPSLGTKSFSLAANFESRKYTWIGPLNHNHLRITRFLSFLCIVGLNDFAKSLVEFMKKTAPEQGGWINPRSLQYWEGEGLQAV